MGGAPAVLELLRDIDLQLAGHITTATRDGLPLIAQPAPKLPAMSRREARERREFADHLDDCDGCSAGFPCMWARQKADE